MLAIGVHRSRLLCLTVSAKIIGCISLCRSALTTRSAKGPAISYEGFCCPAQDVMRLSCQKLENNFRNHLHEGRFECLGLGTKYPNCGKYATRSFKYMNVSDTTPEIWNQNDIFAPRTQLGDQRCFIVVDHEAFCDLRARSLHSKHSGNNNRVVISKV